jgi:hypothetical protein
MPLHICNSSQLPLFSALSDARQHLMDVLTCFKSFVCPWPAPQCDVSDLIDAAETCRTQCVVYYLVLSHLQADSCALPAPA